MKKDVDLLRKVTTEMNEAYEIKRRVVVGETAATETSRAIRRNAFETAHGVQSAEAAYQASLVTDRSINLLIDAANELEIIYRQTKAHMLPVVQAQAKSAFAADEALNLRNALVDTAKFTMDVIQYTADATITLGNQVFDLAKQPLLDVDRLHGMQDKLNNMIEDLKQRKDEWSKINARVANPTDSPHLAAKL